MSNFPQKLSFATVSMNRLAHVKKTLPKNLVDNSSHYNTEFVVLDYNSTDGLMKWILRDLHHYLECGILKLFRTDAPSCFHRSHSRNLAFRLCSGSIICNVDADNYTGKGFASYITEKFHNEDDIFISADMEGGKYYVRDAFGRICLKKDDFFKVRGYDEQMDCYGFEDYDLINRLTGANLTQRKITDLNYLKVIEHNDEERYGNEFLRKNLIQAFICHKDPGTSKLLFFLKNHVYIGGEVGDSYVENAENFNHLTVDPPSLYKYRYVLKNGYWKRGNWKNSFSGFCLKENDASITTELVRKDSHTLISANGEAYIVVKEEGLISQMVSCYSQLANRYIMETNTKKKDVLINPTGYGAGFVTDCFSNQTIRLD